MKPVNMDKIYREVPPDKIPWNIEAPPDALVELVDSELIKPCKVIDLGCGTGHYAVWLASRGFEVTGIDISPTAIGMAKENATKKGVNCDFLAVDMLGELEEIQDTFDFAYDWEVLHHIFPETREKYARNVHKLLKPGGRYLSVCFSEESPQFGGKGKYRETPLKTLLYFSSETELREVFSRFFQVNELKTIQIEGKYAPHLAVWGLMVK